MTPLVYTPRQTARLLQCSERHIYNLIGRGVLPVVPEMGRKVLIPRNAIEALVASASPAVVASPPAAATGNGAAGTPVQRSGSPFTNLPAASSIQKDVDPGLQPEADEDSGRLTTAEAG